MNGETIGTGLEVRFDSAGEPIRGVVFAPPSDPAPALVLIPDVHGVAPLYEEIAARLASHGFRTLVLDIYSREGAPDLPDMAAVQRWIDALPDARVIGDVEAAVRHLAGRPEVAGRKIGVLGFCLGGQYALMSACRVDGLSACVSFYGMLRHATSAANKLPPPLETAADLRCPLLGLYGAEDPLIPPVDLRAFEDALRSAGKPYTLRTFAGAGHAFMNDRRPEAYRPEAASEAFREAVAFLGKTVG